jgi:hypothetical protein
VPLGSSTEPSFPLNITRLEDTDPGPPFTITVDRVRGNAKGVKVTGSVRNDGPETYEAIGVKGTFFNETGFWLGSVDAHCPCPFLEPGATCPFSLKTYPDDYVSYRLHAEGRPAEQREPASLALRVSNLSTDGIGNVRITGTATNANPFDVTNVTVAGVLTDAGGALTSLGSTLLPGDLAPGETAPFDLRIEFEPYVTYRVYAVGTRK